MNTYTLLNQVRRHEDIHLSQLSTTPWRHTPCLTTYLAMKTYPCLTKYHAMKTHAVVEVCVLNHGDRRSLTLRPFYPRERYAVLIAQEAGWAPEPVLTWWRTETIPCPCRESNPGRTPLSSIATLTNLFRIFKYTVQISFVVWGFSDINDDNAINSNDHIAISTYVTFRPQCIDIAPPERCNETEGKATGAWGWPPTTT